MRELGKILFFSLTIGCGVQLGNGNREEDPPIAVVVKGPVSLRCDILDSPEKVAYSDVGCSLTNDDGVAVAGANYSFTAQSPEISVKTLAESRAYGVQYRVSSASRELSLSAALGLEVSAAHDDSVVRAVVKEVLANDWITDPDSVTATGNCVGESCIVIYLPNNLYWVRSSNGLHPYEEARASCANLVYGGYDNWRLPSLTELQKALRGGLSAVASFKDRFAQQFTGSPVYWTEDSDAADSNATAVKWEAASSRATVETHARSDTIGVLCVR